MASLDRFSAPGPHEIGRPTPIITKSCLDCEHAKTALVEKGGYEEFIISCCGEEEIYNGHTGYDMLDSPPCSGTFFKRRETA